MNELRPISEMNKEKFGEKIGQNLKLAWIFEKSWEKAILVILCLLGMWKIWGWIF